MGVRLPRNILSRSPQEASRLLALSYLDQLGRAASRLGDPSDAEALHAFRVALRRLRSCLRAYRPALTGSVSRKTRRRLKAFTLGTNVGRDAEVHLAWLRDQRPRLNPDELEGVGWMMGRLELRKSEVRGQLTAKIARRFPKLESKIRSRLYTYELEISTARGPEPASFAELTAELIRAYAQGLCESIPAVENRDNMAQAHVARIRGKRLRYLLEPLSPRLPRARGYVNRLKRLQDELGTLHDLQVLIESIPKTAGLQSIDVGLGALRRCAEESAELAVRRFQANWSHPRAVGFLEGMTALAHNLEEISRAGAEPGGSSATAKDAPTQVMEDRAEAPFPSLSLATTPLPLPLPLPPKQRLR